MDLFVANDTTANHSSSTGAAAGLKRSVWLPVSDTAIQAAAFSMGVDAADFDGDGWQEPVRRQH